MMRRLKRQKKKDNHLFLKCLVVFLILTIIAYVVTVFWFVWNDKFVPDSLNYTFLPSIIAQLGLMHNITRKNKDVKIAQIQSECQENKGGIL